MDSVTICMMLPVIVSKILLITNVFGGKIKQIKKSDNKEKGK